MSPRSRDSVFFSLVSSPREPTLPICRPRKQSCRPRFLLAVLGTLLIGTCCLALWHPAPARWAKLNLTRWGQHSWAPHQLGRDLIGTKGVLVRSFVQRLFGNYDATAYHHHHMQQQHLHSQAAHEPVTHHTDHHSHGPDAAVRVLPPQESWGIFELNAPMGRDGHTSSLGQFRDHVVMVVAMEEESGSLKYDNFEGLTQTYDKYKYHGFRVLGFPCSKSGRNNTDVPRFAHQLRSEFIIFSQVEVSGASAHPVFRFLADHMPQQHAEEDAGHHEHPAGYHLGERPDVITCNWSKILVGGNGLPIKQYGPHYDIGHIEHDVYHTLYDLLHEYLP